MPKPNHEWKVLPHGPVTELDSGLYVVTGQIPMPLMELPRRMTIVRLQDGRLLIWSAIALDEAGMDKLEGIGKPAFLVVPSDHHRIDASSWKFRYPDLQVITPEGSRDKVSDVVDVDSTAPDFGDDGVRFMTVPGTAGEEGALIVRRAEGTTLVLNDIVGNIRHPSGFGGWVLRMMGIAGDEAQVPKAVEMLIVKNRQELAAQLREWATITDLRRIIVSHGDIIEADPQRVLRELADDLQD